MSTSKTWGRKLLEPEVEHAPDITADIERSMNHFFLNEFEEDEHTAKTEPIIVPPLNPLMLHAISLHQHANNIAELIKLNEFTKKPEKLDAKIPELSKYEVSNKSNLNFTPQDFKEYTAGNEVRIPEISRTVIRHILTKCIATICAHFGYEKSQQSAIDVLSEVLQEFYKKVAHHIQVAVEDEETRQMAGFPHIIERVLTEMGMGGIKGLNDYYQSQVIKYIDVLENRCKELNEEYQALSVPKCPSPVDKINKVVRVKVEEEDVVEVENPEVHFSTIDGDVNFSILETGYQLLNSLEAEANLQSLGEGVEDISVSESPGLVPIPAEDISHLSPYSKKKRFK